jgi:UDP-N-acetylmuramate dehydrogenase
MSHADRARERLAGISNLTVLEGAPLSRYTRFAIGGPADLYAETENEDAFVAASGLARAMGLACVVIGSGTNLIVNDSGYRGLVLRFAARRLARDGKLVTADAGAELQALVDFSNDAGLAGLETLAGIPGSAGAAVYGNAGAYGHSISERIRSVRFFDGAQVRTFDNAACGFAYRESVFKRHREWVILSAELELEPGDAALLRRTAADIVKIRNEKFPITMKCAGSVFKNLLLAELPAAVAAQVPPAVVREGKIPAAWFLEQVGAKGMREGDIHVAAYHANLIYNAGQGTAAQLCALIGELKARVEARFGLQLEEEVQYVGFPGREPAYTSA